MMINRKMMERETINFLEILFSLEEIEKVALKEVNISSPKDAENIKSGLDECFHDCLSDVDINIWIRLHAKDFNDKDQTPIYKAFFRRLQIDEDIFGIIFQERNRTENTEVLRICLKTGFRIDLICHLRCDRDAPMLPEKDLWKGSPRESESADAFWFKAVQALAKLLRGDYLIADHLAHMLLMEGLVLQMEERDAVYGTNFHRYGYGEELVYRKLDITDYRKYLGGQDETCSHIAANLIRAVISYDLLSARSDGKYYKRKDQFFEIWDSLISV